MPVDLTPMQVTQWNLSYQRQFLSAMMFDVTYMGNKTTNIWSGYEENPIVYIPGNCQAGQYALTAAGPCSNATTANRQARSLLTLLNPPQASNTPPHPSRNSTTAARMYRACASSDAALRAGALAPPTRGHVHTEGETGGAGISATRTDSDRRHHQQQPAPGTHANKAPASRIAATT